MSTIVTRAGKGSPLTFTEADANFTNLNTGKPEKDGTVAFDAGTAAAPSVHVGTEQTGLYSGTSKLSSTVNGVNFSTSYRPSAYAYVHSVGMATPYTDWSWAFSNVYAQTVGQYGEAAMINDTSSISYFSHGMYLKNGNTAYTNTGGVTPAWLKMSGGQISFVGATASGTAGNTITQVVVARTDPSYTGTTAGALYLTSGCLAFPATQVPSTDANTLDDYEEGTWTPVDNSGAGLSFTGVNARYIKIGKTVWVGGGLTYPATASGAVASIGGLPFSVNPINAALAVGYSSETTLKAALAINGGTAINLYAAASTIANSTLSGDEVTFAGTYQASA